MCFMFSVARCDVGFSFSSNTACVYLDFASTNRVMALNSAPDGNFAMSACTCPICVGRVALRSSAVFRTK